MILDPKATSRSPDGWEVWTTGKRWQAIRKDATADDRFAWGPMRDDPDRAVQDAFALVLEHPPIE